MNREGPVEAELAWLERFTPATARAAAALPDLTGERILVVCHLDVKMVPMFAALTGAGAEVWACAANPATTRDQVAAHLTGLGVRVAARAGDPPGRHAANLAAGPGWRRPGPASTGWPGSTSPTRCSTGTTCPSSRGCTTGTWSA
jgi:hypothetical protein